MLVHSLLHCEQNHEELYQNLQEVAVIFSP